MSEFYVHPPPPVVWSQFVRFRRTPSHLISTDILYGCFQVEKRICVVFAALVGPRLGCHIHGSHQFRD